MCHNYELVKWLIENHFKYDVESCVNHATATAQMKIVQLLKPKNKECAPLDKIREHEFHFTILGCVSFSYTRREKDDEKAGVAICTTPRNAAG